MLVNLVVSDLVRCRLKFKCDFILGTYTGEKFSRVVKIEMQGTKCLFRRRYVGSQSHFKYQTRENILDF